MFRTNEDVRDDHEFFVFSPGTFKSMTKRSHSRLKFTREQFWYKLLPYESVNPTIKISLLENRTPLPRKMKCITTLRLQRQKIKESLKVYCPPPPTIYMYTHLIYMYTHLQVKTAWVSRHEEISRVMKYCIRLDCKLDCRLDCESLTETNPIAYSNLNTHTHLHTRAHTHTHTYTRTCIGLHCKSDQI